MYMENFYCSHVKDNSTWERATTYSGVYFKHSVTMIFDALKMQREVLNAENNQRVIYEQPFKGHFFFKNNVSYIV